MTIPLARTNKQLTLLLRIYKRPIDHTDNSHVLPVVHSFLRRNTEMSKPWKKFQIYKSIQQVNTLTIWKWFLRLSNHLVIKRFRCNTNLDCMAVDLPCEAYHLCVNSLHHPDYLDLIWTLFCISNFPKCRNLFLSKWLNF